MTNTLNITEQYENVYLPIINDFTKRVSESYGIDVVARLNLDTENRVITEFVVEGQVAFINDTSVDYFFTEVDYVKKSISDLLEQGERLIGLYHTFKPYILKSTFAEFYVTRELELPEIHNDVFTIEHVWLVDAFDEFYVEFDFKIASTDASVYSNMELPEKIQMSVFLKDTDLNLLLKQYETVLSTGKLPAMINLF